MRTYRYLFSYACFTCRKAFKQPLREERWIETGHGKRLREIVDHVCPECSGKLYFMGRKFKPPRREDESAWQTVYERYTQAPNLQTKGTRLLYQIEQAAGIKKRR